MERYSIIPNLLDILVFIILFSVPVAALFLDLKTTPGERIIVETPDGRYEYPLMKDNYLRFNGRVGKFTVIVRNHMVWVDETHCPRKICKRFKISKPGDEIVCLPNMIIIRIEGGKEQLDGITE